MKVKITEYTGPEENRKDITIGGIYKVLNSEDKWGRIYVEDNVGELHAIKKGCFEVLEEEWSGEGLPPVGTVCEILGTPSGSWAEGAIDYIDSKHCIWHWFDEPPAHTMYNRVFDMGFRPIKSEKQKEIDKIASELLESVNKTGEDFRHFEQPIAEHLYNAGLRFIGEKQ